MVTTPDITLIKESWIEVKRIKPEILGDVFYTKLFYDNPALRKMFPLEMEEQNKKLIDMLNIIIERLENLDEIKGEIIAVANRHVDYGVRPEHYDMVGSALLWTLQKALGKNWTDELKTAWVNCYTELAGTMITAPSK
jgi:hemoglobin-like flavoprotein